MLGRVGFDPRRLEVEITETGLMSDPVSAGKAIDDLRSSGIRVSLDDFGTGQSSLGRLRDFQFDKLKIDRSFVATMLDDRPSEHIIRAILAMCDGLGVDVIAEGDRAGSPGRAPAAVRLRLGPGLSCSAARSSAGATLSGLRETLRARA